MTALSSATLSHLLATYGYWAVFALVALESAGLPVPGETALIAAAVYAGTGHNLDVALVIAAASAGAILGDNVGYWVGRRLGAPLLRRYGRAIHLSEERQAVAQKLFRRHGGIIVVIGRFVALLRAVVALLAGINAMNWRRFLLFNTLGGVAWATFYGLAAYSVGHAFHRLAGPLQFATLAFGVFALVVGWIIVRRRAAAALALATLDQGEQPRD